MLRPPLAIALLWVGVLPLPPQPPRYRLEPWQQRPGTLARTYTAAQIALLEKLNRADRQHLDALPVLVIPESWDCDELAHAPMPRQTPQAGKFLLVDLTLQAFGAYADGRMVRWGPISSGARHSPTPTGEYHINWKSPGRHSTVDPDWYMPWYMNFSNRAGLALHAYALPGYPASHGCVRLLERDAIWLYEWVDIWHLASDGQRVESPGTPLLIQDSPSQLDAVSPAPRSEMESRLPASGSASPWPPSPQ